MAHTADSRSLQLRDSITPGADSVRIPHTGNTRPSHGSRLPILYHESKLILWVVVNTMCPCLYHEPYWYHGSMSIPWVLVSTKSPSLYHESKSMPWVLVITLSPCLYHESLLIPRVQIYTMIPCQYQESMSISWVLINTKSLNLYHESKSLPWVQVSTMRQRSEFWKWYLKVQEVPKGPRYSKST